MIVTNKYVLLQVLHRINLSLDDEERLEFFTTFQKDVVHRGSLQLRTGALIGLPSTFCYRTVDDVECSSVVVGEKAVNWSSLAGEELLNALVLSDKAKAFVIAREIFDVKSFRVHLQTLLQSACLISVYITGGVLNERFLLTLRLKPWARFSVFSFIAAAWLLIYITLDDALHCRYDNSVDKAAARLRKIYAEGGVEYYDSVLKRNRALRTLLGSRGDKQFTYYGNIVSVWRNHTVQLTTRRDNLLKYLAEYKGQEETVVQPDFDQNEEADIGA